MFELLEFVVHDLILLGLVEVEVLHHLIVQQRRVRPVLQLILQHQQLSFEILQTSFVASNVATFVLASILILHEGVALQLVHIGIFLRLLGASHPLHQAFPPLEVLAIMRPVSFLLQFSLGRVLVLVLLDGRT